ncbi:type IV pilus modification protein PilV [Microbulbifer variabilis]|uniref:type IV pilus modification protein PilV n=1 Tax=Microbulbifer variabilis TaxID=266805 RepID=UPI00035DEAD1|nr:type IV pilus modification protein PilV [Microbulbifer variabilis]
MHKQSGATLIEVLVSVLVLAIGLLGLASTQMMSLKNGNGSHHRYMAALAAQEIIERMRANPTGFKSGDYDSSDIGSSVGSSPDCSSGCQPSQLAGLDLYEWGLLLSNNLPSATGEIVSKGGQVTVTINWKEQHTGEDYAGSKADLDDAIFEMSVEL